MSGIEIVLEAMASSHGPQFGFNIPEKKKKPLKSIVPPDPEGGALFSAYNQFHSVSFNLDDKNLGRNEEVLLDRYREMEKSPECETPLDELLNELIMTDETGESIQINLENVKGLSPQIKTKITEEWNNILRLYNFREKGFDIAKRWYVDGRIHFQLMVAEENLSEGIKEVRYVDAKKIKKVVRPKITKRADGTVFQDTPRYIPNGQAAGAMVHPEYEEVYLYNQEGISKSAVNAVEITKDSIAYSHSGIVDHRSGNVLSNLHAAIKPYNVLRMLEDAFILYKLSRAPERRIFYIDVGEMPHHISEKYLQATIERFKNKLTYNSSDGTVSNDRLHNTMLQDYFLAQRGNSGTKVHTLEGGNSDFTDMNQVDYHVRKLYRALKIPLSRMEDGGAFNMGRTSEISRDEVKFNKFIKRLRLKFIQFLVDTLKVQLVLKNIVDSEEFEKFEQDIRYDFREDNMFTEMKAIEMFGMRIDLLARFDPEFYRKEYFSKEWLQRNIMRFTDQEISEMQLQINKEKKTNPEWYTTEFDLNGSEGNNKDSSPKPANRQSGGFSSGNK